MTVPPPWCATPFGSPQFPSSAGHGVLEPLFDNCRSINHDLDHDQFTVTLVTVVGPLFRPSVDFSVAPRREHDSQADLKDVSPGGGPNLPVLSHRERPGGPGAPQEGPRNEPSASIKRAKGLQEAFQEQLFIVLKQT